MSKLLLYLALSLLGGFTFSLAYWVGYVVWFLIFSNPITTNLFVAGFVIIFIVCLLWENI